MESEFIQECTANFAAFTEVISSYTPVLLSLAFAAFQCAI
jgi:hypothetical protein